MLRAFGIVLLTFTLVLAACGGDDDNAPTATTSSAAPGNPTATSATPASTAPTATAASSSGSGTVQGVRAPLAVGSSAEVAAINPDPMVEDDDLGTVKVTINAIIDPAETDSPIFQPAAGNKYWALEITLEATGDKTVNNGLWYMSTTDGQEYESLYLTGVGEDIIYGPIEPGESETGVIVFEIPEDATVAEVLGDMSIYVGGNIIFEAE